MANSGAGTDVFAVAGDIQAAIEALSDAEAYRLHRVARLLIRATEYDQPQDLLNEVFTRAMQAAIGEPGRRWPKSRVPFVAFVIETMKGLVNDSRESAWVTRSTSLEQAYVAAEGDGVPPGSPPSVEEKLLDLEARDAAELKAGQAVSKIEELFENDEEVGLMLECLKDGMIGAAVISACGFRDQTHYETVRRRMRRRIEKVFPKGRPA